MGWAPATSPAEPPTDCRMVVVDDAVLTPFSRGELRSDSGPRRCMRGAVHDRTGALVTESQRWWAGDPISPAAGDPDWTAVPTDVSRLPGSWVYAGHWTRHFGHFVVEVLTNLWPDPAELADRPVGIVAHRSFRGAAPASDRGGLQPVELSPWQAELLRLAGYGGLEVRVVRNRRARADRLLVPSRPVVLKSWAQRPAVELWRRVSEAVATRGQDRRVYLSRARFHAQAEGEERVRSDADWDAALDDTFARAGFRVVHPERLPMADQIALVRGADVLAGPSGSALHLSAFARQGTRVLELGDARSPDVPMPSQRMIDAACGHLTQFVGHRDIAALGDALRTV